jgi:hypothetical protein
MMDVQEYEKEIDIEIFTMFRRLRKCRRCGHFPCPCCVVWCDVIYINEEGEPEKECPCYADDCKCWWTYDDMECNKEVLKIYFNLTSVIEEDLKAEYGEGQRRTGV